MTSKITSNARWLAFLVFLSSSFWVANAWAAGGFEFNRETYDQIMRWVNFLILAGLIIKYARRPIANFLKEKKEEVATAINKLESRKKEIQQKFEESQRQLSASQERLVSIKSKIMAEGENRKAQIIADAQRESRLMMETAQLRIEHQIREMHSHLKAELIDTATQMALTKLPGILTPADQDNLIDQWMEAVQP